MKIEKIAADDAILKELGTRFARLRLDRNLTQSQLAELAGISKRTTERLEAGSVATQLSGFIRVCRALEIIERFDLLLPEPSLSPIDQLKLHGRTRQRAAPKKKKKTSSKSWHWGDEG